MRAFPTVAPRALVALLVAPLLCCSLVIERDRTQCESDVDCLTRFGLTGRVCRVGFCVEDVGLDAGPDAASALDAGQDATVAPDAAPVDVLLTADNAYAFGWGDATSLSTFEAPLNASFGDIFGCPVLKHGDTCDAQFGCGPEAYVVPAADTTPSTYFYVVAWSDESGTQGALGQFRRGTADPLYSGDDPWEVCATGIQVATRGPSKADVVARLALCNAGSSEVFSRGWVGRNGAVTAGALGRLAVGEDNSRGSAGEPGGVPGDGVFPIACQESNGTPGIDPAARWMWYQPDAFATAAEAFTNSSGNATGTYLIFRVRAADVPVTSSN